MMIKKPMRTEISQDQKIDMIFKFLFGQKNAEREQIFWNDLSQKEQGEIQNIQKEKTQNFSDVKERFLGKK